MNRFLRACVLGFGFSLALPVLATGCASGSAPLSVNSPSSEEERIATQAKNQACRVRGQFSEDLRYGFLSWAIEDEVPEPVRRSLIIYGAIAGIGGSGFPVWSEGDRTWIATNAHVLEMIDSEVILTFDAGETNLNGKVVYIDTKKDIGFIEVKTAMPVVSFRNAVYEHMPVYAAGYPSGIYQITPGRVSNRCFKLSDIERRLSDDCWVQHTAAIDPGSSGGPVFSEHGQEVIGMNTLSVRSRNDLYLAIPADTIQERLRFARESMRTNKTESGRHESLRAACHQFVSELDSSLYRLDSLNRTLSDELVIDMGLEALKEFKENQELSERFMSIIVAFFPYEIVRSAVLLKLRETAKKLGGLPHDERCENINPADDLMDGASVARVMVRFEEARVETAWRFDRGAWRLVYLRPRPNEDVERQRNGDAIEGIFGSKCEDIRRRGGKVPEGGCATEDDANEDKGKDKDKKSVEPEDGDKKSGDCEEGSKAEGSDASSGCSCVEDEESQESRCECAG